MAGHGWVGEDIEEENVPVRAVLGTQDRIVRRSQSHQKLYDNQSTSQI